jgi:ribosomal-protein-alanine N-acetyltransferase
LLNINFIPFPLLATSRLSLRNITFEDVNEIFIQRSDPRILKYIKRLPVKNLLEAEEWIKKINGQEKRNESVMWGIVPKGEKKLIGTACYWNIEVEDHRAELGYSLHPDYFGKGIMHEALSAIIPYGFNSMNLKSINAFTNKDNLQSLNLLKRNGFRRNLFFENEKVDKEELEYNVVYTLNRQSNSN